MAQTMKEILRDTILTQMQPHISGEEMDILDRKSTRLNSSHIH